MILVLRFFDDPMLQVDVAQEQIDAWRKNKQEKDGSVWKAILLALIYHIGESNYVVGELFNMMEMRPLVDQCKKHGGIIILSGDLKMTSHMLNIGPHSSTHPLVWSLFSQRPDMSRPEVCVVPLLSALCISVKHV